MHLVPELLRIAPHGFVILQGGPNEMSQPRPLEQGLHDPFQIFRRLMCCKSDEALHSSIVKLDMKYKLYRQK
jgi:hypothetical protein